MEVDYVIVGGGSAGAALAARLSEDSRVTVALLEAGDRPPERALMPVACATLQLDPETDWMLTADAGRAGLGLKGRRMPVPRGRMLGGSSGINYMAWVHGHPGDFDRWAELGAEGWSHDDVLPYFRRAEDVVPTNEAVIDGPVRGTGGPVGVSVRSPVIPASRDFVVAAASTGMTHGDYNGRDRLDPAGVTSLFQTSTRGGRRSSTYHAYLAGEAEARANLTIVTGAHATHVVLDDEDGLRATGVEYRDVDGNVQVVNAAYEVILSGGAVGSPHLLMLSGIGPRRELEAAGVRCRLDNPHVGRHLKDHLQCGMFFAAPGIGMSLTEVAISVGPDALRAPAGPLPADPADDADLPDALLALKAEAERRLGEWAATGHGVASSSLYDAVAFCSTGLGDKHSHDAQIAFIPCTYDLGLYENQLNIDLTKLSADAATLFATTAENVTFLPNPVLPHSEGEVVLTSADPSVPPTIAMNYFADPHDLRVMVAVMRRTLAIAAAWPGPHRLGPWLVPPDLARAHHHVEGEAPSNALLESMALHFSTTVYHLCCTCRIGDVVDPELRVIGVRDLRVADASVMPDIISGNTNAAAIMIGERAADLIASIHKNAA
ncbi:GMC family oxidoreductase [uncultured Sphingomonas sp.]|uniref:GMC family oxidoreductase n=1 Tax=uncultured Sphingomonas sp. TaxID=158754 RepID=UPI0035CBC918